MLWSRLYTLALAAMVSFSAIILGPSIAQAECRELLSSIVEQIPNSPIGVYGKNDFLSELAQEEPTYSHRRLKETSSPVNLDTLMKLEEGKYVFAVIDLHHLGEIDFRLGKLRFDPSENAHGHIDLTWGFKIWAAGEFILRKKTTPQGQTTFHIKLTSRSGTYHPEASRLFHAAQWLIEQDLPIAEIELADHNQKTFKRLQVATLNPRFL